jgi:16S rRNA G966 N2-methylase RsmD
VIPTYEAGDRRVVLSEDLLRYEQGDRRGGEALGQIPGLSLQGLALGDGIFLEIPGEFDAADGSEAAAFAPAVANIMAQQVQGVFAARPESQPYLAGTRIWGQSHDLDRALGAQRKRIALAQSLEESAIARGTNYFGTKRRLAALLVEAVHGQAGEDTMVLDLMTGSGAAAAAFSQHWPTVASDAQAFSRILARVQGAGFSEARAVRALEAVMREAKENAAMLDSRIAQFVEDEARIFAMRSNDEARHAYAQLVDSFPTLGNSIVDERWNPYEEVEKRRLDSDLSPYCLFLTYFANAYFGIRQAIEIDSIRLGISRLSDVDDQTWALGALIAAISDLNTGFGGHFAQPRAHPRTLSHRQLLDLLSRRRLSVADEFSARLLLLGRESGQKQREITVVPGPWQAALDAFQNKARNRPGVVYFDPPYRREEYSRYYHALETLVSYGYPSASGSGLTPDKSRGERFNSEFFSRSAATLIEVLTRVISEVVVRGWTCCWSYSDQAAVLPAEVLETLSREAKVEICSFGAPHRHRGHGRDARLRSVTEYLIVVRPVP